MGSWLQSLTRPDDTLLVLYGLVILGYGVLGTVLAVRRRSLPSEVRSREAPHGARQGGGPSTASPDRGRDREAPP